MSYSYIQVDPRLIKLDELVATYHRKTDAHGDRICTGYDERDRCKMPATAWQFHQVNLYAKQLFRELAEEAKAIMLSIWDSNHKESMRIDLWTKDMPVDEMKIFFHQTLVAMSETFKRATNDEKMADTMMDFCDYFAEKLELKK